MVCLAGISAGLIDSSYFEFRQMKSKKKTLKKNQYDILYLPATENLSLKITTESVQLAVLLALLFLAYLNASKSDSIPSYVMY